MTTKKIPQLSSYTTAFTGSEQYELSSANVSYSVTAINMMKATSVLPDAGNSLAPLTDFMVPLFKISDGQTYATTLSQIESDFSFLIGNGDVTGPAGATDTALARYDGTTGKLLQDSAVKLSASALTPTADDGVALGTTALEWSDLFLASGGVINWAAGDVTITHASNTLTFAGASSGYQYDALVAPSSSDGAALGSATLMWSDAFLASGAVINFNNGNYTLTHAAGTLTAAGGPFTAPSFIPSGSTIPSDGIYLPASNTLGFAINSAAEVQLTASALSPSVSDGNALGTSSLMWADLFLASGGVINWNAGDVTVTHSANALAFAGASSGYSFDAVVLPASNDGAALGAAATSWSDLFLASGAVINFANGNFTATHSSGALALSGVVTVASATATPAAGSTSARLLFGTTAGFGIYYGSGAPTVSAAQGSFYLRSDGTTTNDRAYINTNGSTTWTALTTAA